MGVVLGIEWSYVVDDPDVDLRAGQFKDQQRRPRRQRVAQWDEVGHTALADILVSPRHGVV